MIKMIVSMQFLLSLKMFEVMDDESLELSDHVLWYKFILLIVVIFGVKYSYKVLIDHFELIHGVMEVYLTSSWARVS